MPVWVVGWIWGVQQGRGEDVEVGEYSEAIDRGKARGSDRRGVMTEFVLCVWVRVACREGKDRWGNRHGD